MDNHNDHIDRIVDCLAGKASEDQVKELDQWLAESDDNKQVYRDVVRSYYQINNNANWDKVNVFAAKKNINSKLKSKKKVPFWSIAASIAVMLGVGLAVLFTDFSKEEQLAKAEVIEAGQKGAELILSNGQSYELKNSQDLLKEKDGSVLKIDSTKGIVYDTKASNRQELIYNTIKVARGQEYNMQLADGTKVWMNADSELKFPVEFVGTNRKVFLKGEAYFDVAKNKNKQFIVNAHGQDVKVYGTEFNVNAYDESLVKTVLVEGCVSVTMESYGVEEEMLPGELFMANCKNGSTSKQKVDVYPYIAWKDGNFIFRNERLEDIMQRLERWYQIKVFFADHESKEQLLVGDMKRYDSIDKLLYFIQKGTNVQFDVTGDVIVVKSK
ncbi:FecR family protein [Marinifilum sp. RC60d5]|uniref:FecR family protein n=1 Tax=Marinifilum sp. RC60d5 TaxID=3458414 RepID=UPI0040350229